MISRPSFTNLVQAAPGESVTPDERGGSITRKVYRTDTHTVAHFPTAVGTINPLYDSFQQSGVDDEKGHAYEFVNKFKTVDLFVSNAAIPYAPAAHDSAWGNWRTGYVSENVFLILEGQPNFAFSYNHEYGNALDALNNGFISNAKQGMELARSLDSTGTDKDGNDTTAGRFMSQWKKAPKWQGVSPINLGSDLNLVFTFGQAGIFSGEHEVVRPILRLASLFLPRPAGDDDILKNYFKGPFPTAPGYLAQFMSDPNALTDLANMTKTGVEAGLQLTAATLTTTARTLLSGQTPPDEPPQAKDIDTDRISDAVGRLTKLEQQIFAKLDSTIAGALGADSQALCIRVGRMTTGPYAVKNINWSFDFSQTDEYGFPYKGTIKFGGLEYIRIPKHDQVDKLFGIGTVAPIAGSIRSPNHIAAVESAGGID